jgi:hypothetical protein
MKNEFIDKALVIGAVGGFGLLMVGGVISIVDITTSKVSKPLLSYTTAKQLRYVTFIGGGIALLSVIALGLRD